MPNDERVELKLDIKQETDKAYLVSDGDVTVWLAKSQVNYDGDEFSVPEWLAKEKGLV